MVSARNFCTIKHLHCAQINIVHLRATETTISAVNKRFCKFLCRRETVGTMKKSLLWIHRCCNVALAGLLSVILCLGVFDYIIPDSISVYQGGALPRFLQGAVTLQDEASEVFADTAHAQSGALCTKSDADARLFGLVTLKNVEINNIATRRVLPGGMLFGVKLYTQGLLVIGIQEVQTDTGTQTPAKDAGIAIKDVICAVNDIRVETLSEFSKTVKETQGQRVKLTGLRESETKEIYLTPQKSVKDGEYRCGMMLRDSISGIGTVTFIDEESGIFCGLGHGICDADTGTLLPLSRGTLMQVALSGIHPGKNGCPGELCGYFTPNRTGSLLGNTNSGVFGVFSDIPPTDEPISLGLAKDVTCGKAQILCTVDTNGNRAAYDIEIIHLNGSNQDSKNFTIEITDPDLLQATGGIVQGMSGSPVIQNGKLIGAVTHVMVDDPTKGYGIFIENMISAMPAAMEG